MAPATGLISTPNDLCKFMNIFRKENKFFSEYTKRLMTKIEINDVPHQDGHSLGFKREY